MSTKTWRNASCLSNRSKPIPNVVALANSLNQSQKGHYWVGQTPMMRFGSAGAYAALRNPVHSKSNLYVNVFTVTSFADAPLIAKVWLNAKPPLCVRISRLIANTNTSMRPTPASPIQLVYAENKKFGRTGVNVFDRVVPGLSTVVAEEDGKYIIPPGKSFLISIQPIGSMSVRAALAFGWFLPC